MHASFNNHDVVHKHRLHKIHLLQPHRSRLPERRLPERRLPDQRAALTTHLQVAGRRENNATPHHVVRHQSSQSTPHLGPEHARAALAIPHRKLCKRVNGDTPRECTARKPSG